MSTLTIDGHPHETRASSDYLKLIVALPLKPITSVAEYDRAADMIDRLALKPKLTRGERDYLDALNVFIDAYDDADSGAIEAIVPLDMLKALMEHRGMTTTDLGQLLGSKGAASEILHGKRGISKSHMLKLAGHFRVDPGVFLSR